MVRFFFQFLSLYLCKNWLSSFFHYKKMQIFNTTVTKNVMPPPHATFGPSFRTYPKSIMIQRWKSNFSILTTVLKESIKTLFQLIVVGKKIDKKWQIDSFSLKTYRHEKTQLSTLEIFKTSSSLYDYTQQR